MADHTILTTTRTNRVLFVAQKNPDYDSVGASDLFQFYTITPKDALAGCLHQQRTAATNGSDMGTAFVVDRASLLFGIKDVVRDSIIHGCLRKSQLWEKIQECLA